MPEQKKTLSTTSGIVQKVIFFGLIVLSALALWVSIKDTELYSSVLRTSLNRLTSTPLEFSIPTPGEFYVEAGPSSFMADARVMAMVIDTGTSTPSNVEIPFEIGGAFIPLLNLTNPDNPQEVILVVLFPEGHFTDQKRFIGRMPFATATEGQFELKNILIGSLPLL